MLTGARDYSSRFLQDDRFFSRLLSRERYNPSSQPTGGESSFRVYYGGAAGSVPFLWESRPGTPKHPSAHSAPPPLTPPPSYQLSTPSRPNYNKSKRRNPKIFKSIFSKKVNGLLPAPPSKSPSSSSSSTSSFSSSYSAPCTPCRSQGDGNGSDAVSCFKRRNQSQIGVCNFSPIRSVKKAVLAIVGH